MTLYWPDEAECILILNALMDVLPKAMLETINIGSVTVIDKAVKATPVNGTRRAIGGKYYKKSNYYSKYYKKSGGYYRRGYYYRRGSAGSAQNSDQETEIKSDTYQIDPEEIAEAVNATRSAQRKKALHE